MKIIYFIIGVAIAVFLGTLFSLFYRTNAASIVVPSGLIGYWRLNEGSASTTQDLSGSNLPGTLGNFGGPAAAWTTSRVGLSNAIDFDGVNDIIDVPGDTYDNMGEITVSAWIKPNGYGEGNRGRVVDKANGTAPTNGWIFNMTNGVANAIIFLLDGSTDLNLRSSADAVPFGVWTHVAVTWNGNATCSGNAIIYINGVANTVCNANLVSRTSDAAETLKIGNDKSFVRTFDGIIDDVRIYNRALTLTEIQRIYSLRNLGGQGISR